MTQPTLFEVPPAPGPAAAWPARLVATPSPPRPAILPPHQRHVLSSRDGAVAIAPEHGTLSALALQELRRCGGLSIQELAERLSAVRGRPTKEGTCCGVLHRLRKAKLVRDSGRRWKSPSGVNCIVWVAAGASDAT